MFQLLRQFFSRSKQAAPEPERVVPDSELKERYRQSVRHYAYGSILMALGTKLAKVDDGAVNAAEAGRVSSMIEHLEEPEALLKEAQNDNLPIDHYIKRLTMYFPENRRLFRELMDQLFELAQCDGPLNSTEIDYLHSVAQALQVDDGYMIQKLRAAILPAHTSPYKMLGVAENASRDEVKRAYHKAMGAYHPDRMTGKSFSGIIRECANQRMVLLGDAYEAIKSNSKQRSV